MSQYWQAEQSFVWYEGFVGPPTDYKIIISVADCVKTMAGLHMLSCLSCICNSEQLALTRFTSMNLKISKDEEEQKSTPLVIVHACVVCVLVSLSCF